MFQKLLTVFILIIASLYICYGADTTSGTLQQCSEITALPWNDTVKGLTWYEVVRHPAPKTPLGCVEVEMQTVNKTVLNVTVTYASNLNNLSKHSAYSYNATIDDRNILFLNVTNTPFVPTYYKWINWTDSFIFGCGYTNASDNSTAFGFVLSKSRSYNETTLASALTQEALVSTDFVNVTLNSDAINQSDLCTNGSNKNLPIITTVIALIGFLFKQANIL